QRETACVRDRLSENLSHPHGAQPSVEREGEDFIGIGEQIENGALGFALGQRRQIRQRQPAPGSAQTGKPGDSVSYVQKRASQRDEVKYVLLFLELIDFDSFVANLRLAQSRQN